MCSGFTIRRQMKRGKPVRRQLGIFRRGNWSNRPHRSDWGNWSNRPHRPHRSDWGSWSNRPHRSDWGSWSNRPHWSDRPNSSMQIYKNAGCRFLSVSIIFCVERKSGIQFRWRPSDVHKYFLPVQQEFHGLFLRSFPVQEKKQYTDLPE